MPGLIGDSIQDYASGLSGLANVSDYETRRGLTNAAIDAQNTAGKIKLIGQVAGGLAGGAFGMGGLGSKVVGENAGDWGQALGGADVNDSSSGGSGGSGNSQLLGSMWKALGRNAGGSNGGGIDPADQGNSDVGFSWASGPGD